LDVGHRRVGLLAGGASVGVAISAAEVAKSDLARRSSSRKIAEVQPTERSQLLRAGSFRSGELPT